MRLLVLFETFGTFWDFWAFLRLFVLLETFEIFGIFETFGTFWDVWVSLRVYFLDRDINASRGQLVIEYCSSLQLSSFPYANPPRSATIIMLLSNKNTTKVVRNIAGGSHRIITRLLPASLAFDSGIHRMTFQHRGPRLMMTNEG